MIIIFNKMLFVYKLKIQFEFFSKLQTTIFHVTQWKFLAAEMKQNCIFFKMNLTFKY